jgi:hypothetical protein
VETVCDESAGGADAIEIVVDSDIYITDRGQRSSLTGDVGRILSRTFVSRVVVIFRVLGDASYNVIIGDNTTVSGCAFLRALVVNR